MKYCYCPSGYRIMADDPQTCEWVGTSQYATMKSSIPVIIIAIGILGAFALFQRYLLSRKKHYDADSLDYELLSDNLQDATRIIDYVDTTGTESEKERLKRTIDYGTRKWPKSKEVVFGALDKECDKVLEDGTKVCEVNGTHVRDKIYQDFTMGGHDKVYDFIPDNNGKGEIWIDRDMVKKDKNATIEHESTERTKMKKEGWRSTNGSGYLRAHALANKAEKKYRKEHK